MPVYLLFGYALENLVKPGWEYAVETSQRTPLLNRFAHPAFQRFCEAIESAGELGASKPVGEFLGPRRSNGCDGK